MNKINIKKFLEVIQESLPVSDTPTNNDVDDHYDQGNSEEVNLVDDTIDPDTQAIMELSVDFGYYLNERDFRSLDGRAEYHLYTVDHLIELVKNNDEQNTIKMFNENKIKSEYMDCEFLSITFTEDNEQAEVVYNVTTRVISASDNYFKNLNKKRGKKNSVHEGTPFTTEYTLLVKKEKGIWKIDKFKA